MFAVFFASRKKPARERLLEFGIDRLVSARFTAANRQSVNRVLTVNWVTWQVAQLENTWELEFLSWMDETSQPEIPELIMVSLVLEFAVLAAQICKATTACAELAAATFAGYSIAGSLPRPIRQTESKKLHNVKNAIAVFCSGGH